MLVTLLFCFFFISISCSSYAQGFPGSTPGTATATAHVRGHIESKAGTVFGTLLVRLSGSAVYIPGSSVLPNGDFDFDSVPLGTYMLEITDLSGNRISEQMVTVNNGYTDIAVQLPELRGSAPITGTVSVFELAHKIPAKAKKEFELAAKASSKKDVQSSIQHLEAAVAIDPEFLPARRQLGVFYISTDQPHKVIQTFGEVLKLDPRSALAYASIGFADLQLEKYPEAETASRRALSFDPTMARARYVLALSLASQNKNFPEALGLLENITDQIPIAHFIAAQIFANQGQTDRARTEAKEYLASNDTIQREQARVWLAKLDQQFPPAAAGENAQPDEKKTKIATAAVR